MLRIQPPDTRTLSLEVCYALNFHLFATHTDTDWCRVTCVMNSTSAYTYTYTYIYMHMHLCIPGRGSPGERRRSHRLWAGSEMAGGGQLTCCLLCMPGRVTTLCGCALSSLYFMFLVASMSCEVSKLESCGIFMHAYRFCQAC